MNSIEKLFSLSGKNALVTGAAKGNGEAISRGLAMAGAKVLMVDLLEPELKAASENIPGTDTVTFSCDLTSELPRLFGFVEKEFPQVDILVNNAGITVGHDIFEYPEADWERTLEINLKVPFMLSRFAGKIMKESGGGSIINITSLNSERGFPGNPAYVASKGGLKQLTKSLAYDLGEFGIRVNNVGPGYFRTDMTRKSWNDQERRKMIAENTLLKRWGEPDDLIGAVVFLASDAAKYITGQDVYVDGGWLAKGI